MFGYGTFGPLFVEDRTCSREPIKRCEDCYHNDHTCNGNPSKNGCKTPDNCPYYRKMRVKY